jgi:AraC-like DNA-binding protein
MTKSLHTARVYTSPFPGVFVTVTQSGHQFARHWHDVYGFGFLTRGAQRWRSGRGVVRGYVGDVICTNPGEVHDGEPLGGDTRHWSIVSVDAPTMHSFADVSRGDSEISAPVLSDGHLADAARHLVHVLSCETHATNRLVVEEALTTACTMLIARHACGRATPHVPPADVRAARDRLGDDLANAPTLADLATLTGLSRFQVLRRFAQVYGQPPHAWLRSARVERARQLIRNGMTLSFAAATTGFADQSHMTRAFASHLGYTPGVWQTAIRNRLQDH